MSFFYSKLHNQYDKDNKYIDVIKDMYEDNVLDDDDIKDLKLNKGKDDFERQFLIKVVEKVYFLNIRKLVTTY